MVFRFESMCILSAGSKSEVHRCVVGHSTPAVKTVAVKLIADKEKAYEEGSRLLLVGHKHIISVLDIFEDDGFVGIVMPFAQMDLRLFMGNVTYTTSVMLQIKLQTMAAVHHIHTRGIMHLDIKPENICIDLLAPRDGRDYIGEWHVHCVLLDFGSSIVVEEMAQRLLDSPTPMAVQTTRGYNSPELRAKGIISSACDIYSTGIVFGELIENKMNQSKSAAAMQPLRQLSIDMLHADFKRRPSSREVLMRLGDTHIDKPLMTVHNAPVWLSPVANAFVARCCHKRQWSVADALINDHLSSNLQKLVTLVRSSDLGHIRDAFWILFETSVEEVDGQSPRDGLSVLSILHYFDSRIYLAKEHGFFYAKSLDILSRLSYFILTDDMKLHLWKLSSTSHVCERPVLRCLASAWDAPLAGWCTSNEKLWGVRQEAFPDFAARFVDDWDSSCAEAVKRITADGVL
jgi:serine/threonine protein kinase